MMNKLKAKLKKQGGFTLIEMLIVVAIIAILVAVSIPLVANALEKAKEATDAANERAAKGEVMVTYMSHTIDDTVVFDVDTVYAYDAENGKLSPDVPKGYGQCADHEDEYIIVKYNSATSEVFVSWTNATTVPSTLTVSDNDLCLADAFNTIT